MADLERKVNVRNTLSNCAHAENVDIYNEVIHLLVPSRDLSMTAIYLPSQK